MNKKILTSVLAFVFVMTLFGQGVPIYAGSVLSGPSGLSNQPAVKIPPLPSNEAPAVNWAKRLL